ncbi:MAG TPA: hypothetical protein PLY87_09545 [Planctomycetaceae bacterium]|nr:hypothetical protein [Planctomycetaceae bacterium]HQZ65309.1 hypothetical protein [Planctomycetaceae bacterium]HRA87734.1 hypothetical protein [Planctomycetaceae bacterium]
MKVETATLKDGKTKDYMMVSDPPSGTMKEVYFTPDRREVICFYKDSQAGQDPARAQRLESIIGKYNPTLPRSQGGSAASDVDAAYYRNLFCWPTSIVTRPRFGLVTPTYPGNFFFQEGPCKGQEKNGAWFTLEKPRSILQRMAPKELGNWLNYLRLCIKMARAVARLHQAGLAHSDLSNNNVLVDPLNGASVVIDIDSLVVPGLYPPDVLGTKGYIAPEVLSTLSLPFRDPSRKHPSARTDEHALAVLFYQYLLQRHPLEGRRIPKANTAEEQDFLTYGPQALYCEHPQDKSNRPEAAKFVSVSALGPWLEDLFQRAFVDGVKDANRRPTASEWLKGLVKTFDRTIPCGNANCPQQWYVLLDRGGVVCPFCGTKARQPVPLLRFRSEGRPGQWIQDGSLAVYHHLQLYKWHAFANLFPGPDSDLTPQAYFAWHGGQWLMLNQNLTSLTSAEGNRVPAGQAIALTPGAKIRMSQEPNGRIAEVEMRQP